MITRDLLDKIISDGVVVIPTDTIYGVAASAWSEKAVERSYKIMKRNPKKPFIILISSIGDLALFKIKSDSATRHVLKKLWPGKVSVVLQCSSKRFQYLHRGTKALAFRVPKKSSLIKLLRKTGPLISSSANPQGKKPAETIAEAKKYFADMVDFYVSDGKIKSLPSTLVEIKKGEIRVVRKGVNEKIINNFSKPMRKLSNCGKPHDEEKDEPKDDESCGCSHCGHRCG